LACLHLQWEAYFKFEYKQKLARSKWMLEVFGGREEIRTPDPLLANWGDRWSKQIQVVVWAALNFRFHQNKPS